MYAIRSYYAYEAMKASFEQDRLEAQGLLIPVDIRLSEREAGFKILVFLLPFPKLHKRNNFV